MLKLEMNREVITVFLPAIAIFFFHTLRTLNSYRKDK